VISPTTRATPHSAASCSTRIDLIPSRLAAVVCGIWLALVLACVLCAVALPSIVRVAICAVVVVPGITTLGRFILMMGPLGIRAVEGSNDDQWWVFLGNSTRPVPARLHPDSFRFGVHLMVLRFRTPLGTLSALVVGPLLMPQAYRRLCRIVDRCLHRASGASAGPS
jgi:hypothetical protein